MAHLKETLKEFRGLTIKDLSVKISEAQKKVAHLEQDKLLGKLKNVHEITVLKKNLARLHTILDEKLTEQIENDDK